ncbi:MAG: primosomal protein N' [candidate division WOR-3 bacterium]
MFADVVIPNTKLDELTYRYDENILPQLKVGSAVKVNLRQKRSVGIVVRIKENTLTPNPKEIQAVVETDFCNPKLLRLTNWVSKYYIASWGETLTLAFPKGVYGYRPKKNFELSLTGRGKQESTSILTLEQHRVVKRILPKLQLNSFKIFLLHGVTGSGKTEIYLHLIEETLRLNKSAIVLVPEISLTPFYWERFSQRFCGKLIVLHSGLPTAQRKNYWQRIRAGEFRVVIGPRSAVFAPVRNLGLMVVDEEHDPSYKEKERTPHYHARDVAIMRAKFENSVVILGSATPSVESFYNAQNHRYELLSLRSRIDKKPLPKAIIVDMRRYKESIFSPILLSEINDRLKTAEQMILFLNRRGFSRFILCPNCGYVPKCRFCGIPLVFHKSEKLLSCHYCRYETGLFDNCPNCQGTDFYYQGSGTQKIEMELNRLVDKNLVIRMDRDSTSKRGAAEKLYDLFSAGKAKILVGTQIVTKGFDFPQVTLCGVISADTILNLPDFRSAERTFQMLTQVIGRAGRGELPGKAVIQTFHNDHYAIRYGAQQNFLKFYEREIKIREQLQYPPFTKLVRIRIYSNDEKIALRAGEDLKDKLNNKKGLLVLGPVPAFRPQKRYTHIFQLLLKIQKDCNFHSLLTRQNLIYPKAKVDIDVDPVELL